MTHRHRHVAALAVAAALALTACSGSDDETPAADADEDAPVTISVQGLPPTTDEVSRQAFLDDVEEFETEFPNITVEPTDELYDGAAFTTQFAGGQAPTMIEIPFTAPAALIERGQAADISAEVASIEGLDTLNPAALGVLERDGALYGLPKNVYALGLVYNRELFEQAGLDPDEPPATWDDVRAAAQDVAAATGVAGFAPMTTENGGGWQLTAQTVASGGNLQEEADDAFESTVDSDEVRDVLQWMHDLRFTDESIGTNMLRNQTDVERAFASGEAAMIVATPSYYNRYIQQYGGDPEAFGVTSMPQSGDAGATLIGGTAVIVTETATPEERAAAVKWMNHRYIAPVSDTEAAAAKAETDAADGLAVGIPLLPLFDEEKQVTIDEAIAPHVNIDLDHFAPYIEGVATMEYVAEPPIATQEMYALLDAMVQSVLTEAEADIDALVEGADGQVQALLDAAG